METPEEYAEFQTFTSTFVCDETIEACGYKSWDHFFTRQLRPGSRPVSKPLNDDVITNPCEAVSYRIYRNIKKNTTSSGRQQRLILSTAC